MVAGESQSPTPYRLWCPVHGGVYLTNDEYMRQMLNANDHWRCPVCMARSRFDDKNYEDHMYPEEDES
jgi:hypothetical protein